jgi:hypothetical protein
MIVSLLVLRISRLYYPRVVSLLHRAFGHTEASDIPTDFPKVSNMAALHIHTLPGAPCILKFGAHHQPCFGSFYDGVLIPRLAFQYVAGNLAETEMVVADQAEAAKIAVSIRDYFTLRRRIIYLAGEMPRAR